jgi:hypothetical protein
MVLPLNTFLGDLKIIDTYNFYDFPRFFSVTNDLEDIYLVYWFDETDFSDTWLYVCVSKARFEQVLSGKLDIRDAFILSETGTVFLLEVNFRNELLNCREENPLNIMDDLPPKNVRVF